MYDQTISNVIADGRASGLYDDTDAITLYMLAGPYCIRLIEEFGIVHKLPATTTEEVHILQSSFFKDVQSFENVGTEMSNPFLATGHELVALDTCDVMEHE